MEKAAGGEREKASEKWTGGGGQKGDWQAREKEKGEREKAKGADGGEGRRNGWPLRFNLHVVRVN